MSNRNIDAKGIEIRKATQRAIGGNSSKCSKNKMNKLKSWKNKEKLHCIVFLCVFWVEFR